MSKFMGCLLAVFILASAAQALADPKYYIDLYTEPNLTGMKYRVPIYKDEKDLNLIPLPNGWDLNDKPSSVDYNLPKDWQVLLWEHPYFQGHWIILRGQGRIDNLASSHPNFNFNNVVSSVQWQSVRSDTMGTIGTKNCSLRLYQDPNLQGRIFTVDCNRDVGDLSTIRSDDGRLDFEDLASSLEYNLPPGVKIQLYRDTQYGGPVLVEVSGNGKISSIDGGKNDQISSVKWVGR